MPVCIVKKTSATESGVIQVNGKIAVFKNKNVAKAFLADRGIYCMVGYSFPEMTPKEENEESANVEQEPVA